eukprot:GHVP01003811.1.p1 GENE.GHVP01003811.1~~GHVP01003811.1.p1  ORF type:complete len:219 (-),score=24.55 GHVP01003811.1:473-1129(-)
MDQIQKFFCPAFNNPYNLNAVFLQHYLQQTSSPSESDQVNAFDAFKPLKARISAHERHTPYTEDSNYYIHFYKTQIQEYERELQQLMEQSRFRLHNYHFMSNQESEHLNDLQGIQKTLENSQNQVNEFEEEKKILRARVKEQKLQSQELQSLLKERAERIREHCRFVLPLLIKARMKDIVLRCQSEQARELANLYLDSGGSANPYSESGGSFDEEMEG